MLVVFFTIIFIAELIIAIEVICLIQKARKSVCALSQAVTDNRTIIAGRIADVRNAFGTILKKLKEFGLFVDKKKEDYKKFFTPAILTTIANFILTNDWKKIFMAVDIIFTLKKLLKK